MTGDRTEVRVGMIETAISRVLQTGVLISLALIAIGTLLTFLHHPEYRDGDLSMLALLASGTLSTPALADLPRAAVALDGTAWVALGLAALILTPVTRVAISLIAFAVQRDRTFVAITAAVLAILLTSFWLGGGGA